MSNPTGLYSRIKTWGSADTILGSDLNAEFDNVLNNFNPEMLAGYSQNQAQMQIQTAPGGVGSESLAVSIAGELERLRFQLAAIQGTTYWYQTPAQTIAQLNSALGAASLNNKITSGLTTGTTGSVQPVFLLPANTTNTVTLKATNTAFVYTIAGVSYTISADLSAASLTVAPSSQNTATVNDLTLPQAGTQSSNIIGENGSQITVSAMGTSVSNQLGNICAFKTSAGEYLLGRVSSTTQITQVQRGYFFNSSNALVSRGTLSNGDSLTLMKLTWVYANTALGLTVVYTNPRVSGVAPSSPATGDMWFDTSANIWKTYNSTSFVAANATLIGVCIQDTANTVGARSFDFYATYADLNTIEIFADQQNSGTIVRSRYTGGAINIYGQSLQFPSDYVRWDFSTAMDTGVQAASTIYYFYLDTNGRSWISKVAPFDRRADLKGYYHPGQPWRCLGYGFSNSATQLENVESFFRTDDTPAVSNITAAANNIILPYNIIQREQVVTLTGAAGAFTQVLPPPAQLKGKYITYVRTDNTLANLITLQSWGTAIANPTGTISMTSNPTVITSMSSTSSLAAGQLISGPGIAPNTTVSSLAASAVTMSQSAVLTLTGGTFNFANAAGYSGTVGQQTGYLNYGINGKFTTTLATQYEQVTITSDGYAYFIVNRRYPTDWLNAGVTTIGATTTPGTKGTSVTDNFYWRRVGSNMEVRYEFRQTAAGTAGSGEYLWTLPANMTIDTNVIDPFNTVAARTTTNSSGIMQMGDNTNMFTGTVVVFSSTQVRYQVSNTGGSGFIGSALNPLSTATLSYNASYTLPMLNWGS